MIVVRFFACFGPVCCCWLFLLLLFWFSRLNVRFWSVPMLHFTSCRGDPGFSWHRARPVLAAWPIQHLRKSVEFALSETLRVSSFPIVGKVTVLVVKCQQMRAYNLSLLNVFARIVNSLAFTAFSMCEQLILVVRESIVTELPYYEQNNPPKETSFGGSSIHLSYNALFRFRFFVLFGGHESKSIELILVRTRESSNEPISK